LLVPTAFQEGPYSFRFYSSDETEPIHIHVWSDGHRAKFWMNPITLVEQRGFSKSDMQKIRKILRKRASEIITAWENQFDD